jgi:hypothetical protein
MIMCESRHELEIIMIMCESIDKVSPTKSGGIPFTRKAPKR